MRYSSSFLLYMVNCPFLIWAQVLEQAFQACESLLGRQGQERARIPARGAPGPRARCPGPDKVSNGIIFHHTAISHSCRGYMLITHHISEVSKAFPKIKRSKISYASSIISEGLSLDAPSEVIALRGARKTLLRASHFLPHLRLKQFPI